VGAWPRARPPPLALASLPSLWELIPRRAAPGTGFFFLAPGRPSAEPSPQPRRKSFPYMREGGPKLPSRQPGRVFRGPPVLRTRCAESTRAAGRVSSSGGRGAGRPRILEPQRLALPALAGPGLGPSPGGAGLRMACQGGEAVPRGGGEARYVNPSSASGTRAKPRGACATGAELPPRRRAPDPGRPSARARRSAPWFRAGALGLIGRVRLAECPARQLPLNAGLSFGKHNPSAYGELCLRPYLDVAAPHPHLPTIVPVAGVRLARRRRRWAWPRPGPHPPHGASPSNGSLDIGDTQ